MLTLTYGVQFPSNGHTVKNNLNTMLTWLRRHYVGVSYLWFLEFQKRGAPHFHILLSIDAGDTYDRSKIATQWARTQGLMPWEYSRIKDHRLFDVKQSVIKSHRHWSVWQNEKTKNGLSKYVVKYTLKLEQKEIPKNFINVGRFWGCSRDVPLTGGHILDMDDEETRMYLSFKGRQDIAEWDVLPKYILIFDKESERE